MPVGFLMNLVENASSYPSMKWFKPCLDPKDIVYIGLRDLDDAEKVVIKKFGIKAYTVRISYKFIFKFCSAQILISSFLLQMYDVDRLGIGKVMEECNDYLDGRNIHLSFDIDALDPFFAPHTGA